MKHASLPLLGLPCVGACLVRRGAVWKDPTYFRDSFLQRFGMLEGKAAPDASRSGYAGQLSSFRWRRS